MTPLHWACDRGYIDMVECLIQNGADVQAKVCIHTCIYAYCKIIFLYRIMMNRLHFIMVSSFIWCFTFLYYID